MGIFDVNMATPDVGVGEGLHILSWEKSELKMPGLYLGTIYSNKSYYILYTVCSAEIQKPIYIKFLMQIVYRYDLFRKYLYIIY